MRVGFILLCWRTDTGSAGRYSAKRCQSRLHLIASVHVARLLCDHNAVREQLAKLKVARHVSWMQFEELAKMFERGGVVAQLRAFERKSVTGEGVLRLFRDKLFQNLAARFLSLGHESNTRIIAASGRERQVRSRISEWPTHTEERSEASKTRDERNASQAHRSDKRQTHQRVSLRNCGTGDAERCKSPRHHDGG